jgi:hypothetical protein
MDEFAKLTLELFMNKNAYNRYVEKTDPDKHEEHQEYKEKTRKYKERIIDITRRYLDNPDMQITCEMNDMFSDYCKTCIKYFELKDLEETCSYERKEEPDEDTMFDPEQMVEYVSDDASVKANTDASRQKSKYTMDAFFRSK